MSERDRERLPIDGLDYRLVPPGVADERGLAFAAMLRRALEEAHPKDLDLVDYDQVDARLLPALVRGRSLQEFMFEGITEAIVRTFLKNAVPLHQKKGTVAGIRFGLGLIGMRLRFTNWNETDPAGDPNTYDAVIYVDDDLLDEGSVLTPKARAAAIAMFDAMKRWSQEGDELFGTSSSSTTRAGALARCGGIIRTRALAPSDQSERAPLTIAAASRTGGFHHTTGLGAAA